MSERLEEKLSEIEALLAKVTPGQWWLCDGDQSDPLIVAAPHGVTDLRGAKVVLGCALGDGDSEPHYIVEDADARLMTVAPAYIAWLVAQLRRARKDAERWRFFERADVYMDCTGRGAYLRFHCVVAGSNDRGEQSFSGLTKGIAVDNAIAASSPSGSPEESNP